MLIENGPMPAFWILTSRPTGACDADMDTTAAGADPPMLVVAPMIAVTAVDGRRVAPMLDGRGRRCSRNQSDRERGRSSRCRPTGDAAMDTVDGADPPMLLFAPDPFGVYASPACTPRFPA
jgi:hypothetical protein